MDQQQARERWRTATSFAEVCELTARFIEGALPYFPSYVTEDVDPETAPLVEDLVALNRGGFFTDFSQPGGTYDDGWAQRAAVQGFAMPNVARRIRQVAVTTDMLVFTFPPSSRECRGARFPVTREHDRENTVIANHPLGGIEGYMDAAPMAAAELASCWAVCAADPIWGRSGELWPLLLEAVGAP